MKTRPVQIVTRCLLAAWMLAATWGTSSTYLHSHDGGGLAHQHDEHGSAISHDLTPASPHHECEGDTIPAAPSVHRHGCLVLLGALAYQPVPERSSDSHQRHSCGWETVVAISNAQSVRSPSKSLAASCWGLAVLAALPVGCVCETRRPEYSRAGAMPASTLCDRARHERSGVLLA
jgi:hypothetical protein